VLEADFPSIPPATPAELEAALPSDPPPRPGQPHLPGAERLELDIPSKPPPARERKSFELEAPLPSTPEASPGLASRRDDDLEASLRPPSQDPIAVPAFGGEIEISAETPSFRVDLKSDLPPRIAAPPRVALVREPRPLPRAERPSSTPMPQRGYGLVALGVGAIVAAIGVALADQRLRGEDGTAGFMVGPLSPTALAAMLLGTGVVVLLVRFLPRDR
jgi:hypothetical protein